MATLTSEYQYIGRSNAVTCPAGWSYYILLYAKTVGDTATGRHSVTVKQRLVCNANSTFYGWNTSGSVTVAGTSAISWTRGIIPSVDWEGSLTENGITYARYVDLKEGTVQVNTGYGAAKDVTVESSWVMNDSYSAGWFPASGVYANASVTVTLPMIAGASQPSVSASSVDMGTKLTIYTNRLSDSFTHTLSYQFGSASGTIAENVGASCQWYPDISLARQVPDAVSGTAIITCTTYANGEPIGSKQTTVVLTVPASVVPTVSADWTDASGAYDKLETLVQNVSRLTVDVTGTGIYGSEPVSSAVTLNGKTYGSGIITDSGELSLVVSVTDSRGRTGTKSYPITAAPYSAPQLSVSASRCLSDGTADDTGDCARITVSGYVTQVNGKNTAELTLTYGSTTEKVSLTPGDIAYQTEVFYADPNATMTISAALSDALAATTRSMTLSTGYATVDYLKGGKGVSFGKAATREGFDCAMPAYFTGGINGAYLLTRYVGGTNKLRLQTKYSGFTGTGDNRQSIFLFGSANFAPVCGLLMVSNAGSLSWSGTGTVSAAAGENGTVELTLPNPSWDWFTLLSAEYIAAA